MAYVIVEGIDFTGKTTYIGKLKEKLQEIYDVDIVTVLEPSDHNERCAEIRQLVKFDPTVTPEQATTLLIESREILMREVVVPAIKAGKMVLSDRSFVTNMVYQHKLGEGEGMFQILQRNAEMLEKVGPQAIPDYGILLEIGYKTFKLRSSERYTDEQERPLHIEANFNKTKDLYRSAMLFTKQISKDFDYSEDIGIESMALVLGARYGLKKKEAEAA